MLAFRLERAPTYGATRIFVFSNVESNQAEFLAQFLEVCEGDLGTRKIVRARTANTRAPTMARARLFGILAG